MKTKQYLLASALCLAPYAAGAADLPAKAPAYYPPPVSPFSWTGFYVGASAGIISQGTRADWGTVSGFSILSSDISGFGFIGGGDIGYNWQFAPNWVIGLEADFSGVSLHHSDSFSNGSETLSSRLNALGTVRARLGYAFDRALLYATGGWAYGHVKNASISTFSPLNHSTDDWKGGWTAGGGLEYAITPNTWTVRVEALYVDLGSTNFDTASSGCRFGFRNRYVIGRLGVNYKF